jgi:hypothetical protein
MKVEDHSMLGYDSIQWQFVTDVLEESSASIFRVAITRWTQQAPLKHW